MFQRYIVSAYKKEHEHKLCPEFHKLVGGYHYVRLDDTHIFAVVFVKETHLSHLQGLASTHVCDSLHRKKSVDKALRDKGMHAHANALATHGIASSDTTIDVIDKMIAKFGISSFEPSV